MSVLFVLETQQYFSLEATGFFKMIFMGLKTTTTKKITKRTTTLVA